MTVGWAIPAKVKVTIFLWPTIKVPDKAMVPSPTFWQYRYKGILRCNIAVERISQADFSDEEMKNRLVAEARFLRGYFYFELVKNFGGVPLITGFLLPEEIQGITRASAEDVYKFIEDDLKAAADVLPQRSQYAATDMGRATRGAALGLLGKVYLYQEMARAQ